MSAKRALECQHRWLCVFRHALRLAVDGAARDFQFGVVKHRLERATGFKCCFCSAATRQTRMFASLAPNSTSTLRTHTSITNNCVNRSELRCTSTRLQPPLRLWLDRPHTPRPPSLFLQPQRRLLDQLSRRTTAVELIEASFSARRPNSRKGRGCGLSHRAHTHVCQRESARGCRRALFCAGAAAQPIGRHGGRAAQPDHLRAEPVREAPERG